jgi:hypothetical protein
MLLFDAPMRETCVVRRSRTNTPLQALATLNDPQFFEAARAMAERVLKAETSDDRSADLAFRAATGRLPKVEERAVLLKLLAQHKAEFWADHAAAHKMLEVGESPRDPTLDTVEHAAWTLVCNLVLNLDETLTQH